MHTIGIYFKCFMEMCVSGDLTLKLRAEREESIIFR